MKTTWFVPWVKWVFSFRIKKRPKPRVPTWAETQEKATAERIALAKANVGGSWDRHSAMEALVAAGVIPPSSRVISSTRGQSGPRGPVGPRGSVGPTREAG
jgi:hypothetical protein